MACASRGGGGLRPPCLEFRVSGIEIELKSLEVETGALQLILQFGDERRIGVWAELFAVKLRVERSQSTVDLALLPLFQNGHGLGDVDPPV